MTWYKDDIVTLQKDNLKGYIRTEKPTPDLLLGYRDGTFDVLRLLQEIADNQSIKSVDEMRKALLNLRKERFDLIDDMDKAEEKTKNIKLNPQPN